MFTFSQKGNLINGTINGDVFGINHSVDVFNKMSELEAALDNAATPSEAKEIVEAFKLLIVENPKDKRSSEVHPDIFISNEGKYYLTYDGKVTSVAIPQNLLWRFELAKEKGLDTTPLVKCWVRFLRNHKLRNICRTAGERELFAERVFSYIDKDFVNHEMINELVDNKGYSEEVAIAMSTVKQVQITKEGLIKSYKVSREITKRFRLNEKGEKESYDVYEAKVIGIDPITGVMLYDEKQSLHNESRVFEPAVVGSSNEAFYCGDAKGHIIRVGQVHRLEDWSSINTDDYRSCVKGLHVGNIDYIKGYQNDQTETHNILIDPAHIGAVTDNGDGAIRVMQYFVLDAFSGINGSLYHSSGYARLTDAQWDTEKQAILKEFGELQEKKTAEFNEKIV